MRVEPFGDEPTLRRARSAVPLSAVLARRGFRILLEGDAAVVQPGVLLRPPRNLPPFDPSRITTVDWSGVNIRRESQGPARDPGTIQARVIAIMVDDLTWSIVFDDDDTGELADIVAIRDTGTDLIVRLVHCKFSTEDQPGARVGDFYEVCGQAQRSARHRNDVPALLHRLLYRERARQASGLATRFERGSIDDIYTLLDAASARRHILEVVIAQPGLSAAAVTPNILDLLASTETYLREAADATLDIFASP